MTVRSPAPTSMAPWIGSRTSTGRKLARPFKRRQRREAWRSPGFVSARKRRYPRRVRPRRAADEDQEHPPRDEACGRGVGRPGDASQPVRASHSAEPGSAPRRGRPEVRRHHPLPEHLPRGQPDAADHPAVPRGGAGYRGGGLQAPGHGLPRHAPRHDRRAAAQVRAGPLQASRTDAPPPVPRPPRSQGQRDGHGSPKGVSGPCTFVLGDHGPRRRHGAAGHHPRRGHLGPV